MCSLYAFGYLRAEPLFKKFTLFSPLSHPLILASPVFAILKNVIALYLCAFQISKSRTAIWKIYPDFTPASPSDFGITNFCDITQCKSATFIYFLCAFQIFRSQTAIWKIYPDFTPESPSEFGITNFYDIKHCNGTTLMCFSCVCQIPKSRIAI